MKILLANKYLYPRGGDCVYTLRLMDLLTANGHQVAPFTMHHPENIDSAYSHYFVPHIDFRKELKSLSIGGAFKVSSRAVINRQAVKQMERLIEDFQPDIVHLQNIHHQLTPAIFGPAVKRNIPVVWTLHDYNLFCPDHLFLRDGQPCDKCAGGNFSHAVINRCKKGSFGASLIAALECSLFPPKKLAGWVTRFICPSRFLADVLVKHGIAESKVTNIPNFLPSFNIEPDGSDYLLYVGRLSPEKGVDTLLEAFQRVGRGKLIIAGDGPTRRELEMKAADMTSCDVEFVGQLTQQAVFQLLSGSLATVAPSTCWENFPFTVLEAMAAQKPVIASRTGGMPEQIEHGRTGLLFEPGNVRQLAEHISYLLDNPHLAQEMGDKGYARVMSEYGPEKHYERIIQVYNEAIDNLTYGARQSHRRVFESATMGAEGR